MKPNKDWLTIKNIKILTEKFHEKFVQNTKNIKKQNKQTFFKIVFSLVGLTTLSQLL